MATASALGLLKGLVYAKTLGVTELGYLGIAVLVQQFGIYISTLGTLSALNQVLPIAYGRDDDSAVGLESRSLVIVALTSLFSAALSLAILALIWPSDPDLRLALGLAALAAAVTGLGEYFILVVRARRQILVLGWMFLLRAVLAICLGTAASIAFGFAGAIIAEVIAIVRSGAPDLVSVASRSQTAVAAPSGRSAPLPPWSHTDAGESDHRGHHSC